MAPPKSSAVVVHHTGSLVWVPERGSETSGAKAKASRWVKGTVTEVLPEKDGKRKVMVLTEEGQSHSLLSEECPLQNERDDTVDDLVKSDFLHEPGILHTLRVRYTLDMIYTYSGNILIAANPHKAVPYLYGGRMMTQYRGVPLGELSPHVYAIAEQAYGAMMIDNQKQAILISGESGAGKTESAKMVMQYLANRTSNLQSPAKVAGKAKGKGNAASLGGSAPVEEQVLESNPLLEAFGNAKTSRNDNSSRFGKFVEIDFDVAGRVCGASISTYLLERSRVVSVRAPERTYHIFYQLCAGASEEERRMYRLEGGAESFRYMRYDSAPLEGVDDGEAFRSTLAAMKVVGLADQEIESVLATVAAVLHLGNIKFSGADEATLKDDASRNSLGIVADLLQVGPAGLLTALTTRTIVAMGERIVKQLSASAAAESLDALAKSLYAKLFDWLVAAVNRKISAIGTGQRTNRAIGILDIYGFESFVENSFEQLCINLANERLQQQFNQHVFKGEQEEYAREGIDWSYVEFVDNQDCLDLLEGAPGQSLGVFPLIDEACRLPRATYQDLSHTIRSKLAAHPRFEAPKAKPHSFAVDHYAGKVLYATQTLLDKNKDFVVAEHAQLIASSESPFLRAIFEDADSPSAAPGPAGRGRAQQSAFKLNSVGAQFRKQLQGLMTTLTACHPHFIRCIKPNPESRRGSLNPEYVLEQLRAGGVLEAVRIATMGFPTRKPFKPFVQRYAILLANGRGEYRPVDTDNLDEAEAAEMSRKVLQAAKLGGWQIGKSRVFLRAGQLAQLEGERGRRLAASAVTIQAAFRGWQARRQLKEARVAATKIQAAWRGCLGRKAAAERRRERAAEIMQARWRCRAARKAFLLAQMHRRATVVQSYVRMYLVRSRFRRETIAGKKAAARAAERQKRDDAAVVIQSHVRRLIAGKKLEALRAEARRWQELETAAAAAEAARQAAEADRGQLAHEVSVWQRRYEAEVAKNAALSANALTLQMQLESAQKENQLHSTEPSRGGVDQEQVAALEAAHAAALAALAAEMEGVRRQKEDAEERSQEMELQVEDLRAQVAGKASEVEAMLAAAAEKDRENSALWEQVRAAAAEYHEEFAAKEAAIAALTAEVVAAKQQLQAEVERLRQEMEAEVAGVRAQMQARVEEAVAEAEAKAAGLRDAREKNVHFSARVVALNTRVTQLQKQLRDSAAREKALTADLEAAQKAAQAVERTTSARNLKPEANGVRQVGTPPRGYRRSGDPDQPATPGQVSEYVSLEAEHEHCLRFLIAGVVDRRMQIVSIQYGAKPSDSIGMPVAAWVVGESLLHWAQTWRTAEVDVSALRVRDAIVAGAETDGLPAQAYWLSVTLALGAFLKVRSIGKRDCSNLFKLGDEMIQFGALHQLLAASVADMLPISVGVLLSDDAKRLARQGSLRPGMQPPAAATALAKQQSGENTASPWQGLLGGLSNVVETLRVEGAPPPAVRAVVHAALRYVDAELLNALVLRRDCCSISAIKALQSGLADIRAWAGYVGAQWVGEGSDVEAALEHVGQAVRYLLQGKDDLTRKASKGFDITMDLRRMCPSLTLQQIYKLTEHHHDDWITGVGNTGTLTLVLLKALKRVVDDRPASPGGSPSAPGSHSPMSSDSGNAFGARRGGSLEEDSLLLDSNAAFVLPRRLLTDAARYFVQAPKAYQSTRPGISLLELIEESCRRSVQLPAQMASLQQFSFLR